MKEKIDDIFKSKLGNIQAPPASHVKLGLVKQVSSIIIKNTIISTTMIVSSAAAVSVTGKIVYDHLTEDSSSSIIAEDTSQKPEYVLETALYTDYLNLDRLNPDLISRVALVNHQNTSEINHPISESQTEHHVIDNKKQVLTSSDQTNSLLSVEKGTNTYTALSPDVTTSLSAQTKTDLDPFLDEYSLSDLSTDTSNEVNTHNSLDLSNAEKQIQDLTNSLFVLKREVALTNSSDIEANELIEQLAADIEKLKSDVSIENGLQSFKEPALEAKETSELNHISLLQNKSGLLLANSDGIGLIQTDPRQYKSLFNGWSLGVSYSFCPLYDLSKLTHPDINSVHLQDVTTTVQTATAELTKNLGRFNITSGLGLQTLDQEFIAQIRNTVIVETGSYVDVYETVIIDGTPTEVVVGQEYQIVESEETTNDQITSNTSLKYFTIPLNFEFSLLNGGKNQIGLTGGINYSRVLSANGHFLNQESEQIEPLTASSDALNKSMTSYNLGLNVSKALTKRLYFQINPMFRIITSDQYKTDVRSTLNYSGLELKTSLQIKL